MTHEAVAGAARARPYGWFGLPLSLAGILVGGVALVALALAAVFGGSAVLLGWDGAARRVSSLRAVAQGDSDGAEFLLLCLSVLLYAGVAVAVFAAARLRGGRAWRDLVGWHAWGGKRRLKAFATVAAATLIYSVAANAALAHFYPASQDWVKLPGDRATAALFFLVAALAAPLTEELVFRGWLYTALRAKLGLWPSLVVSSVLFAVAHWESSHLYALTVFPVGLALGWLRERTGTLKASIALHALFNSAAFVLLRLGG